MLAIVWRACSKGTRSPNLLAVAALIMFVARAVGQNFQRGGDLCGCIRTCSCGTMTASVQERISCVAAAFGAWGGIFGVWYFSAARDARDARISTIERSALRGMQNTGGRVAKRKGARVLRFFFMGSLLLLWRGRAEGRRKRTQKPFQNGGETGQKGRTCSRNGRAVGTDMDMGAFRSVHHTRTGVGGPTGGTGRRLDTRAAAG